MNDRQKMERYVCTRIPPEGKRVVLTTEGEDGQPFYADLFPLHDEGSDEWELIFESNCPDWASLKEIYDHIRHSEMTTEERWREMTYVSPKREYMKKVELLSINEREIYEAARETVPCVGMNLVANAGHDYNGQTKGILSTLVKLGLFSKVKGGYIRTSMPRI